MNYTLAKELKDAGFPQYLNEVMSAEDVSPQTAYRRRDHRTFDLSLMGYPKTEPDYFTQGKWRPSCIFSKQYLESEEAKNETLYFPSFEEIAEELSKDSIITLIMGKIMATATHGTKGIQTSSANNMYGSNPTVTLARLYIEANKK